MVDRIETPSVTVPANTAQATPITTALNIPDGVPVELEIIVPPGPSGLMGFQILHSGVSRIPRDGAQFIVADGQIFKWPLSNMPTGNKWSIRAYNTDVFDHTIYFFWLMDELPMRAPALATVIPVQLNQPAPVLELP